MVSLFKNNFLTIKIQENKLSKQCNDVEKLYF